MAHKPVNGNLVLPLRKNDLRNVDHQNIKCTKLIQMGAPISKFWNSFNFFQH